ncbi:DNA alkylation repair protein [Bacillus salipaludis]|uniref:DNA alkylation repair protein n=1 Tax=Bacillus salipaludis TaxID=2547811 RepID=UPI003D24EBFA
MRNLSDEVALLTNLFESHRIEANAGPMAKYMKNHFPFLGIKTSQRRELEKQFFHETGILKKPFHPGFVLELWDKTEREYQYTALVYLDKLQKKLQKEDLAFLEGLITTKSWWDSVDVLAPKPVGTIAQKFPEVIGETIESWAVHENMWLRRASILFQLKCKQETREEILYEYIRRNADSKEFFIQKAIGWALREYSKTNPASVRKFIESHKLAPLSVREGSKYI